MDTVILFFLSFFCFMHWEKKNLINNKNKQIFWIFRRCSAKESQERGERRGRSLPNERPRGAEEELPGEEEPIPAPQSESAVRPAGQQVSGSRTFAFANPASDSGEAGNDSNASKLCVVWRMANLKHEIKLLSSGLGCLLYLCPINA